MWYRCIGALCCLTLAMAAAKPDDSTKEKKPAFRVAGVRYQVKDVDRSIAFYTKHLGFRLDQQAGAGLCQSF